MGRGAAVGAPPDASRILDGLSRLCARGPPIEARGDECAPSRNGTHAQFRSVQSRPADLCGIKARRYRAAVRSPLAASALIEMTEHQFGVVVAAPLQLGITCWYCK